MGYTRTKTFDMRFKEGEMAGLEVRCRRVSVGTLFDVGAIVDRRKESKEAFTAAVEELAKVIVSWNYEDDDGNPVPISAETLLEEDADFILGLFKAWTDALGGVPAPLEQASPDGEMEAQIPMTV